MNRTAFGNLHKPALLTLIQTPGYLDLSIDVIQKPLFRFAIRAILGVNAKVLKAHLSLLKDHDNPEVAKLTLALDPSTMLLVQK